MIRAHQYFLSIFAFCFLLIEHPLICADSNEQMPLKKGNLSLPLIQQPSPLVGFGENILDQGTMQVSLLVDEYKKQKGYFIDIAPSFLYGITDIFSVFINLPVTPRFKEKNQHSAGFEDAFIQFEYAFFNANRRTSIEMATFVFNATFPTGSFKKSPTTGSGSPSFFIGGTYSYTAIKWFYFGALGATLTTFHGNSKSADTFLYETGFGRNIASPHGWIFAWIMEIDGSYASRNILKGSIDPNSGGNMIYITPSLWISSKHLTLQIGAGGVLTQHLYGNQSKFTHQILINVGWTLY